MVKEHTRSHWSSRLGFIVAAVGSAVGLGNIWKFPYITGENGGGAFVLIYLACIAIIGIPIFLAELYIGQQSQSDVVDCFGKLLGRKTAWRFTGWGGFLAGFIIMSFYSVVGGWVLKALTVTLFGWQSGAGVPVWTELQGVMASPTQSVFWHFVFMTLTCAIVAGGVKKGIERWTRILMPILFLLLLGLFVRCLFLPGFGKSLTFLFSPDFSRITGAAILEALGHAFFTLSLGMGTIITYGSYLNKKESLVPTALAVSFMDTLIALMAGVVTLTIVFSFGLEAGAGPALMFQTLPTLFAKIQGGYLISVAFFLLVAFAALTSAISILEVIVAYWVEQKQGERVQGAILISLGIFSLGIFSALSFNALAGVSIGGFVSTKGLLFDLFDKLGSSILLPLVGLGFCVFYGWWLGEPAIRATLNQWDRPGLRLGLLWTVRVVAPLAVSAVFLHTVLGWF